MRKVYILAEGKTEIKLLAELNKLGKITPSEIINLPFNCSEHKIEDRLIRMKNQSKTHVFIFFDTDIMTCSDKQKANAALEQFSKNIKILLGHGYHISLFQQHENFEDELVSATQCKNKKTLFNLFNAKGSTEFKALFLNAQNVLTKLEKITFQPTMMWCKPIINILKIKIKPSKKCHYSTGKNLIK